MTKRRKTHDEQQGSMHLQDDDYIPLPIQTFLWRQTSPFVRPFLGKTRDLAQIEQRDACKLFERIIITNNIWGQSPSLTDAIASIDRWRLIKVSFPFVLQCTAALLNNKLIKDHNFNRLGGNEAKMLYTLQWILMNASEECADSENEAKANATSVAMAAATAASLLKPAQTQNSAPTAVSPSSSSSQAPTSGPGLASSTSVAQATNEKSQQPPQQQQQQQQQLVSSSSQLTNLQSQQSGASLVTSHASASQSQSIQRQQHQEQRPTMHQHAQQPASVPSRDSKAPIFNLPPMSSYASTSNRSVIVVPTAASVAASAVAVAAPSGAPTLQMQAMLSSSSSVSPIGSSTPTKPLTPTDQQATISPSNYLLPISSIQMFVYYFAPIMDGLKHSDFLSSNQRLEIGAALWEPLFNHQLPNIQCLVAQIKPSKFKSTSFFSSDVNEYTKTQVMRSTMINNRDSSEQRRSSVSPLDRIQYGDVFLGGTTPARPIASTNSQLRSPLAKQIKRTEFADNQPSAQSNVDQKIDLDRTVVNHATYLDIAVLRCLFITDWQESGVYWAITFLSNRMSEFLYLDNRESTFKLRPKSKSICCLREITRNNNTQELDEDPKEKSQKQASKSTEKEELHQKRQKSDKSHKIDSSRFLRVEDPDSSDSGGDGPKDPKSPVRRLSFSSGMQTLANQIRKTSKRVKKSPVHQQSGDGAKTGSQLSIQHQSSVDGKHGTFSRGRRSSSADDLSLGQVSALSTLQRDSQESRPRDKSITESNPVITVTPNNQFKPADISFGISKQWTRKLDDSHGSILKTFNRRVMLPLDRLVRSQSIPHKIHFSPFETKKDQSEHSDSIGAAHYVDDYGRIDPIVVLKVLHSVSQRENACSQSVCDRIQFLVTKLIDIGILKESFILSRKSSHRKDLEHLLPTKQHEFDSFNKSQGISAQDLSSNLKNQSKSAALKISLIHKILVDIVVRLFSHLGCPARCGMDATVDHFNQGRQAKLTPSGSKSPMTQAMELNKNLRLKLRETLEYLCSFNKQNFIVYIEDLVNERSIQEVIDTFHCILGFCKTEAPPNPGHTATHSTSSHATSVQFAATPGTSGATESHHGSRSGPGGSVSSTRSDISVPETVNESHEPSKAPTHSSDVKKTPDSFEAILIINSFKKLVTKLASVNKELKLQENTVLYCDVRRFLSYVRYNYNSIFRSTILSALIDCAKLMNHQQKTISADTAHLKKTGDLTRPPSDDESIGINGMSGTKRKAYGGEPTDLTDSETRRSGDPSVIGGPASGAHIGSFSKTNDGSLASQPRTSFGSNKFYPISSHPKYKAAQALGQQDQQHGQSAGILSLSKAKKKLEQVFGAKTSVKMKLNPTSLGEDAPCSMSGAPGDQSLYSDIEASRRASMIGQQSLGSFNETLYRPLANIIQSTLKQQSMSIQTIIQQLQMHSTVQQGMTNFSFLMESCAPGDFLDPALLAALLDLKSPIVVRAAIFLECANFVHRCNRGQWPSWMRMNVTMHRNSNTGLMQTSTKGKSSSMQRTVRNNTLMYKAAGKAFYSWAEAVGARLEELLQVEQDNLKTEPINEDTENDDAIASDQGTMTNSLANDFQCSEVDFFQPTLSGNSSPHVLKMAACQLLYEVTTFLRETYRYLPPTIVHHQAATSKMGDKMSSIYDVSRAVTANRRWSMALSSLGFGQLPATLNAISAQNAAASGNTSTSSHLRNPAASTISEHPERRISFILHETNDENEPPEKQEVTLTQAESSPAQALTSPLAAAVTTAEQQQENMRKAASGRHLSQSSASSAVVVAAATCLLRSSGVIDNQTHRRKSIKLRKPNQEKEQRDRRTKFAQDLDEEIENSSTSDAGVRRSDSLRSRRRVSGLSEKSDNSDRPANGHQLATAEGAQHAHAATELSGDDSGGNGSCDEVSNTEIAERAEADESRIMSNMPWFKAVAMVNSNIDCTCSHFPSCRPSCYKMHQNISKKLLTCIQSLYQDTNLERAYLQSVLEKGVHNLQKHNEHKRFSSQQSKIIFNGMPRTSSDCSTMIHTETETKRKDKKSKKYQVTDSPNDSSRGKAASYTRAAMNHLDSIASMNGLTPDVVDTLRAIMIGKSRERASCQKPHEEPQIFKYIRVGIKNLLQCPMSLFLKGAVILPRDNFLDMIKFSWNLLLEDDQQLSRTAAVGFIIASIKCPNEASKLLLDELESNDAARQIAAINKFHVIWDARYQCWPRLEDGAFVHFKMAPPSIEFTLPSPKIAQESKPVVDPPWMPRKTSNVEEVTIGQDQTVQRSFVTATKTRRKQQIEIVTKALREKYDKLREDRENYHITSVPITLYAAYEPTLVNQAGGDEMDATDEDTQQENRALIQMKTAQALFPTCLCKAAIVMINLLDDSRVTYEGSAVHEIAGKVIWSCLVEDPALFLRHFFERLTRQNQNTIFQVLRRLIRFMPRLPPQAAYTLYNYLIGFIIYYIRCPVESSQKLIADTLSVLCLVVPSVYGLFLKDLKQILRKEQCDHNLLITANVPSAKKIIVHGSDSSGIPSQFPIDETTQFYHILVDSLEFFGIEKPKQNEYFLIDVRTNHMHNLHSYVRDYYSFKRSQHPQLQMINMDSSKAFDILQKQELINQFLEFGKVSMSLSIVKTSHMAFQRVLFLHEELMKLPTFPRKALETNFSLFRGPFGHQVFSMDRIHKICWVRVIARMFELTSGFFLQLGDIHLFLNAISGIFVLHCEEASVSRLCLATFINATYQFKNIFAADGFMPIMATIVQVYSNHQNNQLLCRSIEFVCKQFYIMHRKPFLLQLFGSVASKLNTAEIMQQSQTHFSSSQSSGSPSVNSALHDPNRISPKAFFRLIKSLDKAFKDPLDILELVDAEKPLRAIDFCYQQDKESIEILDIISLCVTVTAYASESPRSTQMLIILESVVPLYMKHLQSCTSKKAGQSMGKQAHKDELQKIQSISICIRTLIVNCEGLTRNFNGPLPSIDLRSSSIRRTGPSGNRSTSAARTQNSSTGYALDIYADEPSYTGPDRGKRDHGAGKQTSIVGGLHRGGKTFNSDETEITRGEFIVPRDTLLNLVAEFLSLSTGRLAESAKKYVDLHQKHSSYELLDVKSHLRLAEVANSLLKFASTDPSVMASRGLIRYMNEILPNTEWRQEAIRPALIMILKRLDKTFNRIAKKTWVKRATDWEGAKQLLKGAYLTFIKHPYIVHLPHLKSLINCCQNIILSDNLHGISHLPGSSLLHNIASGVQSGLPASQSSTALPQQASSDKPSGNVLTVGHPPGHPATPSTSAVHSSAHASSQNHTVTPSFAALTSATALASAVSSASVATQGFNSVTIRLIAMQLLQTGDNQTLESLVGNSTNTPEKLESLMLNLIYPMCIRVCSGAREAPKLRMCDIMYILNIVLNMLAPSSASSKSCTSSASSPKTATDTSQFILSKITTTIGSTQTGATALGIVGSTAHSTAGMHHQIAHHPEAHKIGFLGLKILCVCFESQLASEWIRISRVIRDLSLQVGQPSGPLWDFLDFIATFRFPMFILLLPMIKCQLARKVRKENSSEGVAHYIQCQRLIDAKIHGAAPTVCRSRSFLFVSLTAELRMLKEQLIAKHRLMLETERQVPLLAQQSQLSSGLIGSVSQNPGGLGVEATSSDHFGAYHRLSAAIASFANQSSQARTASNASSTMNQQTGTSAALKGAGCFAAQLATSAPITPKVNEGSTSSAKSPCSRNESLQSSIRLTTARSREEARKVMNTILRRTSYPHNQNLSVPEQQASGERKSSQPPSPSSSVSMLRQSGGEFSGSNQIIMDPAMLMAAFQPPRKSNVEGSGILKQLIQTIDKQNQSQKQQQQQQQQLQQQPVAYQTTTLTSAAPIQEPKADSAVQHQPAATTTAHQQQRQQQPQRRQYQQHQKHHQHQQ